MGTLSEAPFCHPSSIPRKLGEQSAARNSLWVCLEPESLPGRESSLSGGLVPVCRLFPGRVPAS